MSERFDKLADLVYSVADTAESLDSDNVKEGKAYEIFSDLEYLKAKLDEAYELALELVREEM
jgi:hypothetical protein